MQSTSQPAKFITPFAQNDGARVEIPVTSTDATRMSQSLGSPPLTGMPPEAGGVPPQLEDFNGAMNQIARAIWWVMGGNRFGFDLAWAGDTLINGYARGAVLPAALGAGTIGLGEWINNAEDNSNSPDTQGTGWVPGYHYGATALSGQTGGTVTLSPAQAAKRVLTIAGSLVSNLVIIVPEWIYDWSIYNNTGGGFTVTVKNAATPGVVIPQNGAPTPVHCDGTSCSLLAANVAPSTSETQALQRQQKGYVRATASGSWTVPPGVTQVVINAVAAGGGGGGSGAAINGATASVGGGGGGGGAGQGLVSVPYAVTPGTVVSWTIGGAGAGAPAVNNGSGTAGSAGGNLVISGPGFNGGTAVTLVGGGGGGGGASTVNNASGGTPGTGQPPGSYGQDATAGASSANGGTGASSAFGGGGPAGRGALITGGGSAPEMIGAPGAGFGTGGGGGGGSYSQGSGTGAAGGAGGPGFILLSW